MTDRTIVQRLRIGTVLTDADGERYVVIDALGGKIKICRIPQGMEPRDFSDKFFHDPTPDDPAHASLERP